MIPPALLTGFRHELVQTERENTFGSGAKQLTSNLYIHVRASRFSFRLPPAVCFYCETPQLNSESMMDSDIQRLILKKAGALLARRAYSRGELRTKLLRSKIPNVADPHELNVALDRLEQLNLLNDDDYAYNFALYRMKREAWGPAKVYNSLLRRQVAPATIESAMERVRSQVDEESILAEYLERYCHRKGSSCEPQDIRKLTTHLRLRGFREDTIFKGLRRIMPPSAMRRFETGE